MKKMRTLCGTILVAVAALAANGGEAEQKTAVFAGATQGGGVIRLGGNYAGHLQDVWRDGNVLYWAHTLALVKTDLSGNVLAKTDVNEHHAGLEVRDGKVYVAVCDMQDKTLTVTRESGSVFPPVLSCMSHTATYTLPSLTSSPA